MDEDTEDNPKHSVNLVELQEVAFEALGKSWPDNQTTQGYCNFIFTRLT